MMGQPPELVALEGLSRPTSKVFCETVGIPIADHKPRQFIERASGRREALKIAACELEPGLLNKGHGALIVVLARSIWVREAAYLRPDDRFEPPLALPDLPILFGLAQEAQFGMPPTCRSEPVAG